MPAQNIIERSFSGGEISPPLYARTDLVKYATGARTLRNMICMRHGGATRRPGSMYVGTTLNGGNSVRLIPFIFDETSNGQSYVLEFGNQYVTFWQNGANIIQSSVQISGITQANPAVVTTVVPHAFANGDFILITGVVGMLEINNRYFIVNNVTPTTFELKDLSGNNFDSTTFTAYVSGGLANKILRVSTPYLQADLSTLDFAQSADVLTITHQNYAPRDLVRNGPLFWNLNLVTFDGTGGEGFPIVTAGGTLTAPPQPGTFYRVTAIMANGDEGVVDPTHSSGGNIVASTANPIVLTWGPVANAVSYRVYKYDLSANFVPSTVVFGFIGNTTDTTFSDSGISPNYEDSPPISGALKSLVASGQYPANVGYVQQRRIFSNVPNNPVGAWASATGSNTNFTVKTPITDEQSFDFNVAGDEVNSIEHILELKSMLVMTAGAELFVQGNGSGVVTPTSINASVQSQYGSSKLRPIKAGDVVLFNQALGSFIRDLSFDFVIDGYRGNDLTVFSSHLFEGHEIADWSYQKTPDSILWAVRDDGILLSLTYVREQQIVAWTRHDFDNGSGGNFLSPPSIVENVVAIPENGDYAVYLCIKRTINGSDVRYIERLSSRIWSDVIDARYLDCHASYDGRNVSSMTMSPTTDSSQLFVEEEISDGIAFTEPSAANTQLLGIVPPGVYTVSALATAVGVAMTAAGTQVYTGSVTGGGLIEITCSGGGSFTLDFSSLSAYFSRSIASLIGYNPTVHSATGFIDGDFQPTSLFATGAAAYQQSLVLTSSGAFFDASMVGNQIFIQDGLWNLSHGQLGNQVRFTITGFTNSTTVTVLPDKPVPASLQTPLTSWARAVSTISGLSYLQGLQVSVWADRFVVASPLNRSMAVMTVPSSGILTLDKQYSVIFVGLPIVSDLETLAIDTAFGESIADQPKAISRVVVSLYNSRGFFGGTENPDTNIDNPISANTGLNDPLFGLIENKAQDDRRYYDPAPNLLSDSQFTNVECNWSKEGRIFIRDVDPIPLSILAVIPAGLTAAKVPYSQRV